jgi:hypothetical protein
VGEAEGLGNTTVAILVILVLGVLWAAVLLPPILRSRSASGHHGVSDFMDHLRSLGRSHAHRHAEVGGPVLHGPVGSPMGAPPRHVSSARGPIAPPLAYRPMPGGVSPMQRRRRNVLMVLAGVVAFTFLVALVMSSMMVWLVFLLSVGALGGYIYMLIRFKHEAAARYAPPKRVYATPVAKDDSPKVGDNVILLRRSVG